MIITRKRKAIIIGKHTAVAYELLATMAAVYESTKLHYGERVAKEILNFCIDEIKTTKVIKHTGKQNKTND